MSIAKQIIWYLFLPFLYVAHFALRLVLRPDNNLANANLIVISFPVGILLAIGTYGVAVILLVRWLT